MDRNLFLHSDAHGAHADVAARVLTDLLGYRRRLTPSPSTLREEAEQVAAVQLPRIRAFVERGERIECVLPAFPTKSPNPNKVLGTVPDMAERISLAFLNTLCERIGSYYAPGARILICSDGHVFGDVIHVSDDVITAYQHAIERLIGEIGATHLGIFDLGDVPALAAHADDYDTLRRQLVARYAEPREAIRARLLGDRQGLLLYRAITRFLFEDARVPGYAGSNTALQRDAKQRAWAVIQRSWAWGNLLAEQFPKAIRLSIHPQPADSLKVGIHMMPTKDDWLTPWHGVAVDVGGRFVLMKRQDAVARQGTVAHAAGVPSHYVLADAQNADAAALPA